MSLFHPGRPSFVDDAMAQTPNSGADGNFFGNVASTIGDIFTDVTGIGADKRQNEWLANQSEIDRMYNSDEAALNRKWIEHMSNTEYQRAVEDMKAAGINPLLAYNQGGASSMSGGSTASHSTSGSSGGSQSGKLLNMIVSGLLKKI